MQRLAVFRRTFRWLAILGFLSSAVPSLAQQERFRCVTYCDAVRLGTSVAEIQMPLAEKPLNKAEATVALRAATLDVTTYEDGFTSGLYASLPSLEPRAFSLKPQAFMPNKIKRTPLKSLTGLEKLRTTIIATSVDKAVPGLRLHRNAPDAPPVVTLKVEGLEPGLEYHWRLPGQGAFGTCEAVTCPVDFIDEPTKQPKRR
jgi:hypothetical protein